MSDTRKQNEELIINQGAEYMRSIKIYESNKGSKKSYFIRPSIDGKVRYISFSSEEDAQSFLKIMPKPTTNTSKKTFVDYFYRIIGEIESNNTKRTYYYTFKQFSKILEKPLSTITFDDLQNCYKEATNSKWNHMSSVLKKISVVSEDEQFKSILSKIDMKDKYRFKSNRREVQKPEDLVNTVMNLDTNGDKNLQIARLTTIILCYTGIRVGELSALTEKDLRDDHIWIEKTIVDGFSFGVAITKTKSIVQPKTKGKANRKVPVDEDIHGLIKEYFSLIKQFERPKNLGVRRSFFQVKLQQMSKVIGIKVTPHLCRHVFGTILGKKCKNFDDAYKLRDMMGHGDFSTTERYITFSKATSKDIMDKMPELKKLK